MLMVCYIKMLGWNVMGNNVLEGLKESEER